MFKSNSSLSVYVGALELSSDVRRGQSHRHGHMRTGSEMKIFTAGEDNADGTPHVFSSE